MTARQAWQSETVCATSCYGEGDTHEHAKHPSALRILIRHLCVLGYSAPRRLPKVLTGAGHVVNTWFAGKGIVFLDASNSNIDATDFVRSARNVRLYRTR